MIIPNELSSQDKKKSHIYRKHTLAESIVFVDGLAGCGKTLLSPILASFERVEIINYSPGIENFCALAFLGKIDQDAAIAMIQTEADLFLYEAMMSRRINLRPDDLSSFWRDPFPLRYLVRLFQQGNETIPLKVTQKKPILHFASHFLLGFSEPIFEAFQSRVFFIEVVRHPLYMIKQQTLNWERLVGTSRNFHLHIQYREEQIPYHFFTNEDLFINSTPVEKAIHEIDLLTRMTEYAKQNELKEYSQNIVTIPFEKFVLNPYPYLSKIQSILHSNPTKKTRTVLKKQNVPRQLFADGIGIKIYKHCGWTPPEKNTNEINEFRIRRDFVKQKCGEKALELLDSMCSTYEKKYMGKEYLPLYS